jgi:hypothetical protein
MSKFEAHLTGITIGDLTPVLVIVRGETPEELATGIRVMAALVANSARESEVITTVMRREHTDKKGKVTPLIDLYPDWRGDYGQFKFLSMYLNTPEDIAAFEHCSSLRLTKLPLYDGQGARTRTQGQPHRCEVKCRPFGVYRVQGKEIVIGDKTERRWEFAGYTEPPQMRREADSSQMDVIADDHPKEPVWWKEIVTEYRKHPSFIDSVDLLVLVLKKYLQQGKIQFTDTPATVRAFMQQTHPGEVL